MKNGNNGHLTTARFEIHPSDPSFGDAALPIAVCYQRAYGYSTAWNEGMVCITCSKPGRPIKFNLADERTHCDKGHELKKFWPIEGIIADMQENLKREGEIGRAHV